MTIFSQSQKFAFVDSEYILDQMESYQKAQKQIDDLAADWQKELDKKLADIEGKVNDLRKNELLLPEDIKEEKELEITTLQNDLRIFQSKKFGVGGDLFKRRKELIQPIQRKVFKAIESLAKDNNYSFVLDKSKNSNILYADPKYDKSDAIIRKLKK
ncbi:OmpH family outer membrane protein [Bacteroidota bacterium]|nr:OmpH family outer membrane protein [Bacteroidota bacterium]